MSLIPVDALGPWMYHVSWSMPGYHIIAATINPLTPVEACIRQWSGSSLVQVIFSRPFGAKPSFKKYMWKCPLQNVVSFVSASMCYQIDYDGHM